MNWFSLVLLRKQVNVETSYTLVTINGLRQDQKEILRLSKIYASIVKAKMPLSHNLQAVAIVRY